MTWGEFCTLLAGLGPETPLGRVVGIRAESNKDMLKNFTPDQHRIRSEWRSREARRITADPAKAASMVAQFQEACKQAFGGGGVQGGR